MCLKKSMRLASIGAHREQLRPVWVVTGHFLGPKFPPSLPATFWWRSPRGQCSAYISVLEVLASRIARLLTLVCIDNGCHCCTTWHVHSDQPARISSSGTDSLLTAIRLLYRTPISRHISLSETLKLAVARFVRNLETPLSEALRECCEAFPSPQVVRKCAQLRRTEELGAWPCSSWPA